MEKEKEAQRNTERGGRKWCQEKGIRVSEDKTKKIIKKTPTKKRREQKNTGS